MTYSVNQMPQNTLIFLRHAETKIESEVPSSKWDLTLFGVTQAQNLAKSEYFLDIQIIISSPEKKAIKTIEPLAEKLKVPIKIIEDLKELDRNKGVFSTTKEYNENVRAAFKKPKQAINNWETVEAASQRFTNQINIIDKQNSEKKILIVSHGIILNLYFASILGETNQIFKRWSRKEFCAYGIIKNGTVVKDIASLQQNIYEFK